MSNKHDVLGANPAAYMYAMGSGMCEIFYNNGTDEQMKWAVLAAERGWGATMVLTEPDAGSDVGAGRTKATQQADGTWHIDGVKRFITSADSASLVNSQFSQRGNPEPNRLITAFWAVCMAGIAVVILMFGGSNALQGLQNLVVVAALPFAVVLVVMCVAMVKELRTDPLAIRDEYARIAVTEAVRHGVDEYGDDFALAVEQTDVESSYSVAAHFDSTAQELTEWYQRTDEDGNPVGYDYATGEYLDEGPGEGPLVGVEGDKA